MIKSKPIPALIVDPDPDFLTSLREEEVAKGLPPVTAKSGKEAQLLLADSTRQFGGVFVNPAVKNPHGVSVIRFTHLHRPVTPVFLLLENNQEPPFEEREVKKLGIEDTLFKPLKYNDYMPLIVPRTVVFDKSLATDATKKHGDKVDSEVAAEDANFVPIRAENFLAGTKSFFDVYVRLGSGKFLKLLQAGDAFTIDRITNYIEKGVTHFYLRKEAQEHYVAYCDKLSRAILGSEKISVSIKSSQVMNQGEETFKFLSDQGVSEKNLQYASAFMKNVNSLTHQLNPGRQPLLKGFLNDVSSYNHGVGTTMLAGMLINSMNITSSDPVETVGLAALLHDIGLYQLELTEFEEDESKMNDEQRKLFYTHPTVGAEILRSVPRIKPIVVQAVEQHHERRNKKGFPNRIGPGSISMIADVVGIADEFNRIIQQTKENPKLDLVELLDERVFKTFSNQLVTEFKKVFLFVDEEAQRRKRALEQAQEEQAAKNGENKSPSEATSEKKEEAKITKEDKKPA